MSEVMSCGERIKEARIAQELGLREAARKLGVSATHLADIEAGRRRPSASLSESLGALLDIDWNWIMGMAGVVPPECGAAVMGNPDAVRLLRWVSNLTRSQHCQLLDVMHSWSEQEAFLFEVRGR